MPLTLDDFIRASEYCCTACPFNDGFTEEATNLQNLACLPTAFDMLEHHERGEVISCHCNNATPCRGMAAVRDVSKDRLVPYEDWYRGA